MKGELWKISDVKHAEGEERVVEAGGMQITIRFVGRRDDELGSRSRRHLEQRSCRRTKREPPRCRTISFNGGFFGASR
jgi:hypothetical protein